MILKSQMLLKFQGDKIKKLCGKNFIYPLFILKVILVQKTNKIPVEIFLIVNFLSSSSHTAAAPTHPPPTHTLSLSLNKQ